MPDEDIRKEPQPATMEEDSDFQHIPFADDMFRSFAKQAEEKGFHRVAQIFAEAAVAYSAKSKK